MIRYDKYNISDNNLDRDAMNSITFTPLIKPIVAPHT